MNIIVIASIIFGVVGFIFALAKPKTIAISKTDTKVIDEYKEEVKTNNKLLKESGEVKYEKVSNAVDAVAVINDVIRNEHNGTGNQS